MAAKLIPIDYNPFESGSTSNYKLVPVDGNPFGDQELKAAHQVADLSKNISENQLKPSHESTVGPESKMDYTLRETARVLSPIARPVLEGGGLMLGGAAGGIGGAETGPGAIATAAAGAGLGYSAGKQAADWLDEYAGVKQPEDLKSRMVKSAKDVGTGAMYEVGGRTVAPVLKAGSKAIGKVIKPVLGRLSGVGTGAIDEALAAAKQAEPELNVLKTKTDYDKALRGEISGEDIVSNAKSALSKIKENRWRDYNSRLNKIKAIPGNMAKILSNTKNSLRDIIGPSQYDIQILPSKKGIEVDFSKSTIVEGQPVVKRAIEDISNWSDTTAGGLDILKKRLGTYIDQAPNRTPAQAFLKKLQSGLKYDLEVNVPGYKEMTKGYHEASQIIDDIEAGLMLRKQGMSGRIVADQTLRRLMSAMRDNFQLRKELLDTLGNKGARELSQQVAGHSMSQVLPRGIAGTGPILASEAFYAHYFNPKFWPVLAASSPRVQGEFLRVFGRYLSSVEKNPDILKEFYKQYSINRKPNKSKKY